MGKRIMLFILTSFLILFVSGCSLTQEFCEHEYEQKDLKESTCTEEGYEILICKSCGKQTKQVLPLKSHVYGEWKYTESYDKIKYCENCDATMRDNSDRIVITNTKKEYNILEKNKIEYILKTLYPVSRTTKDYSWDFIENSANATIEWIKNENSNDYSLFISAKRDGTCTFTLTFKKNYMFETINATSESVTFTFTNNVNIKIAFYDENNVLIKEADGYKYNDTIDFPKLGNDYRWVNEKQEIVTSATVDSENFSFRAIKISNAGTDGLLYELNEDGNTYCVSGYEGFSYDVVIPGVHNDKIVTSIKKGAFKNSVIKSVVLPMSIKTIGSEAFYNCDELTKIELSNCFMLNYIGQSAFKDLKKLPYIFIPNSVKEIGMSAFEDSISTIIVLETNDSNNIKLGSYWSRDVLDVIVDISEVCEDNMYRYAISNEGNTIDIMTCFVEQISANLNLNQYNGYDIGYICDKVFMNRTEIQTIEFGEKLNSIGAYAFYGCSSIEKIDLSNTSLESLGSNSFRYCSNLSYVHLPETMNYVGAYVFDGCTNAYVFFKKSNIENVELGSSWSGYQYEGGYILGYYSDVQEVVCDDKFDYYVDSNDMISIFGYNSDEDIHLDLEEHAGKKIYRICSKAFYNSEKILSVNLGSELTYINSYAFYGCNYIEYVDYKESSSLISLGSYAFSGLPWLVYCHLPKSIRTIGDYVFKNTNNVYVLFEALDNSKVDFGNYWNGGQYVGGPIQGYANNVKSIGKNEEYLYYLTNDGQEVIIRYLNN